MESYSSIVSGLRDSFNKGKTRSVQWRINQLKALTRMYEENESIFLAALKSDLGKPPMESFAGELEFLKNDVIGALRHIDQWTKDIPVEKSPLTVLDTVYQHPEPYGVVLVLGAWNYPLHLALAPLTPAIAAGNVAVVKPSEISPATAQALHDLLPKYLDNSCFKVICGGVPETTELLKQKFDYIFYTGSTAVGKIVRKAANENLTPCTLELGGKSPCYIDASADLEVATKRILWGKATNSGQTCVAPDYILCTKEMEQKLVPCMRKILETWFGHKPQESDSYSRVVSERHLDRLSQVLDSTRGKVAIGGKYDRDDKYMDMTVVTDVTMEDPLMKEELFGPVLPIVNISSAEEAITLINSRDKPLALYVFSSRPKIHELFRDRTSSGGLTINETLLQLSVEQLPFGGVGPSGMGAYHGKAGFDTFTHYKSVLIRDLGWFGEKLGEFRYAPYTEKNLKFSRMIMVNRPLPPTGWIKYFITLLVGVGIGVGLAFLINQPK